MNEEQQLAIYEAILNGEIPLYERMQIDYENDLPYPFPVDGQVIIAKEWARRNPNASRFEIKKMAKKLVVN